MSVPPNMQIENREQLESALQLLRGSAECLGQAHTVLGNHDRVKVYEAKVEHCHKTILDRFFPKPESERLVALRTARKRSANNATMTADRVLIEELIDAAIKEEEAKS